MAMIALLKWLTPGQGQPVALSTPGRVGWHELLAADWEKAFAFYAELFDWQKAGRRHRGGRYVQTVYPPEERRSGGMFTKPPMEPVPFWLYYFNIGDIDAAAEARAGGRRPGPQRAG